MKTLICKGNSCETLNQLIESEIGRRGFVNETYGCRIIAPIRYEFQCRESTVSSVSSICLTFHFRESRARFPRHRTQPITFQFESSPINERIRIKENFVRWSFLLKNVHRRLYASSYLFLIFGGYRAVTR